MADSKISALGAAGALSGSEALPGVQGGATVRITPAQILAYMLGNAATTEQVQDIVGGLLAAGTGLAISYNDAANTLTIASTNPKTNVAANDPTSAADSAAGYSAGSVWTNITTATRWFCQDAGAGAAMWVAQGAMGFPGYVSGYTYGPSRGATGSTFTPVADTLYAIPIVIYQRVTITMLAIRMGTMVAGNVRLGIYANGAGVPTAKLAEVASPPSTGTSGAVSAALTANATLAPGVYWLACLFNAAPTIYSTPSGDQTLLGMLGAATVIAAFSTSSAITGVSAPSAYASGLPATFPSSARIAGAAPLITFTVN